MQISKRLILAVSIVSLALLLGVLGVGCGGSADSPEGTVKTFFAAVADGDEATMKTLVTGKALAKMPKPGSPAFKMMQPMGKAFKEVVDTKVEGDKAVVTVKIDGQMVLEAVRDAMLASIKDPEMKKKMAEQMKASMAKEAKKLESAQMRLEKKDGKWLISEFIEK